MRQSGRNVIARLADQISDRTYGQSYRLESRQESLLQGLERDAFKKTSSKECLAWDVSKRRPQGYHYMTLDDGPR